MTSLLLTPAARLRRVVRRLRGDASSPLAGRTVLVTFSRIAGRETWADNVTFTNIRVSLVRTPMVAPTETYRNLRAATPEQTAEQVVRALEERPITVNTVAGAAAEVLNLVAPRFSDWVMATADRRFPDSAAARSPAGESAGRGLKAG